MNLTESQNSTQIKKKNERHEECFHKYTPIEVTTHNIHFHEESPILSTDVWNDIVATCGCDGAVRLWNLKFKEMNYKENIYRTAGNSSVAIEYSREFLAFSKPINCVRFGRFTDSFILAACSDGGKVVVFTEEKEYLLQGDIDDDSYEICWAENYLFVAMASGKIICYEITVEPGSVENKEQGLALKSRQVFSCKVHEGTIQGMSFNKKNSLLASVSLDKTVKIHRFKEENLFLLGEISTNIDTSRGLFKRIFLDDQQLYLFTKNKTISVYSYPFKEVHLQKSIGPLNAPGLKVMKMNVKNGEIEVICTKKSVYLLQNNNMLCCIDNACYMAITDAFVHNNTVFLSSMDGFISSIRLSVEKD